MRTISREFGSYNARRYSRPWAAKITFDGTKPRYDFCGTFLGEHAGGNGSGSVVIDADPGEIIAIGQKDGRGNGGSNTWYLVEDTGEREITRTEALTIWRARNA